MQCETELTITRHSICVQSVAFIALTSVGTKSVIASLIAGMSCSLTFINVCMHGMAIRYSMVSNNTSLNLVDIIIAEIPHNCVIMRLSRGLKNCVIFP